MISARLLSRTAAIVVIIGLVIYEVSHKSNDETLSPMKQGVESAADTGVSPGSDTNHQKMAPTAMPGSPAQNAKDSQEKFRKLAEKVRATIPRQEDLQKLSASQAHLTPPSIQKAAIGMGQLAQAIADDPKMAPEGLKFYRECAEDATNPNSVRASCYVQHEDLLKTQVHSDEKSLRDDAAVSDHVKKLAEKI